MKSTQIIKIENPHSTDWLDKAVRLLKQAEVVAFPTETVYGIGAHAFLESAVSSIFAIKERKQDKTLPIMIAGLNMLALVSSNPSDESLKLMQAFWPGPLTLILPASRNLPSYLRGPKSTVAVRFPNHPVPLAIIQELHAPLVATSANRSGNPPPLSADDTLQELNGKIPLILDGGKSTFQRESTILDCTQTPVHLIREGTLSRKDIQSVLPCC